jgi:hypothetical protein
MIRDLPISDYHKADGVSSTLLKTVMKSPKHLEHVLINGFKPNKATALGDAIHAYILQPHRFAEMYEEVRDTYLRNIGEHKVGDPKLDENGDPIIMLKHREDSRLDIKGEEYKKFCAILDAYSESEEARKLVDSAKYIEASFFLDQYDGLKLKVRPDFITEDGWIVDVKTVGGDRDKPSAPNQFGRNFFDNGYDIQMFLYYQVVKLYVPDIKGFKFLCLDAKIPSGVQIYEFVDGESQWFELGGYRFYEAIKLYKKYKSQIVHKVYENENPRELPLSYMAEEELAGYRNE